MQVPAPTNGPAVLRVSIGEDDVLLREGIARILTGAGFDVVAQAGDADELLHRSLAQRPDVAIVDVQMPPRHEDDGLLAAIELRHRLPGTGVLILSQFCEPAYAVELISERPQGSATCSRNVWETSPRSWTPFGGSRPAAVPSTPKSSARCSDGRPPATRCPR